MKRRYLLQGLAATVLAVPLVWNSVFSAEKTLNYTPGLIEQNLAAGKTVFVDYAATWCSTCAAQGRVIEELRKENPAYNEKLTFIKVDWDTYKDDKITSSYRVPRRSTLLLLRGDQELGRIVAGTDKQQIKALMEKGLN